MLKLKITQTCSIENCDKAVHGRKMCSMHYRRWLIYGDPLYVKKIFGDDQTRFWSYVNKTDECWIWTGLTGARGYGSLGINGKMVAAHRYSFYLHNGYWPEPFCLHSCDNPPCVNPGHLRAGTAQDNADDRDGRGRFVVLAGESHGSSKLKTQHVMDIKKRIAQGETNEMIAPDYGIHRRTVRDIRYGKTWKHVELC